MALLYILCLLVLHELHIASCQPDRFEPVLTKLSIAILQNGNPMENKIFCPTGITFSMGMLYAGARGDTKSQIGKGLFGNLTDKDVYQFMKGLQDVYSDNNHLSKFYNLSYPHGLYAQNESAILQEFQDILKKYYDTKVKSVDFVKDAESVRKEINDIIDYGTMHEIRNFLPQNSLNGARFVSFMAVYFKGIWKNKFNAANTSKKDFFTSEKQKDVVDMMNQNGTEFYYYEDDDVKVLGLPYDSEEGKEMVMYIILPVERFGLEKVVSTMTAESFQQMLQNGAQKKVQQVDLPKFKLEQDLDTTEVFKKLGMVDMYDPKKADFSGIDGIKDLHVSEIVQKMSFEVNEEGSEASSFGALKASQRTLPVEFICNEPFVFAVVEKKSLNIFFIGRYVSK